MVLKNKAGVGYTPDFQIVVVLYGVKGYQNDVPTSVWDKFLNYKMALLNFKR